MKNRNNVIDSWRAVAVMLVTAFHVFVWSNSKGIELPLGFDVMGAFGNGWVGVGMFFVLSGYCMASSSQKIFSEGINPKNYGMYFLNRLLRISGPYYISIVFWCIVINLFNVAYKPTGLIDIFTHALYVHNFAKETMYSISGVYWSLAVEMQFYAFLPLLVSFFKSVQQRLFLLFLTLAMSVFLNVFSVNPLVTWSILCYLCLFVIGWLCSVYQNYLGKLLGSRRTFVMLSTSFCFALLYKGVRFDNMVKIYEIFTSCMFSLVLVSSIERFSSNYSFIIKGLSFIGRASYSIYLYNYIFWVFKREDLSITQRILIFIFVILFGIVMHLLIETKTEKIRYRLMRKFRIGKESTATTEFN